MGRRKQGHGRSAKNSRKGQSANAEEEDYKRCPHSFVFHRGHVGKNVKRLVMDVRHMLEPFTAVNLKVNKKNVLKDFISVAGPMNVTHLVTFSKSELATYMRLVRLPRGPTMTFKLHSYSLSRDVISTLKRNQATQSQFLSHPLLIMNHLSGEGMHLKLMATMFQNMFPSINVNKLKLNDVKRCVLLNYNPDSKTLDLRHYNIRVVPVGLSKAVKKLVRGQIPNLSSYNDISDFVLRDGNLSESEVEMDGVHNEVTLPQDLPGRGNTKSAKSAIRLSEIGPRITFQLMKIEENVCDGEVLFHEYIEKTPEEVKTLKEMRLHKKNLKQQRRKQQEINVERKQTTKEEMKQKSLAGMKKSVVSKPQDKQADADSDLDNSRDDDYDNDDDDDGNDDDEDDDEEYYRQEVGEEPDPDLFHKKKPSDKSTGRKRPPKLPYKRRQDQHRGSAISANTPTARSKKGRTTTSKSNRKDRQTDLLERKRKFPFKRTTLNVKKTKKVRRK